MILNLIFLRIEEALLEVNQAKTKFGLVVVFIKDFV